MKNKLICWLLCKFNRALGKYGQNAYCKKRDVKTLISEVGLRFKHNPSAWNRFQELLDDVENLVP